MQTIKKALARKLLVVEEHHDEILTQTRRAICKGCPFYDAKKDQCKVCKCIIEIKSELVKNRNPFSIPPMRIEITHCPKGNWGDKEIANHYRKIDGKELL